MSKLEEKKKGLAHKMSAQHSPTKPKNSIDAKLSIQHLKERIEFNKGHIKDHHELIKKGGTEKYNEDHKKHHKEQIKEDKKLIKERAKMLKD